MKTADDTYKFEKVGEFKAEPDLNNYARTDIDAEFNKNVRINQDVIVKCGICTNIVKQFPGNLRYFYVNEDPVSTKAFTPDGKLTDIGTEEDLIFTLEDGSTITKKIRVLSSTTTPTT